MPTPTISGSSPQFLFGFPPRGPSQRGTVGFQHIAHLPDWAKEKAVLELLATADNRLDAVVQCGTNMGMLNIIDRLETVTGVPILAINPVLFWYALRENGIDDPVVGGGRLLRDC